jgi:hypothetical protein
MAAADSGEDPQGQSGRGVYACSARLSRARLFIPPRVPPRVRRHILVRSFQEEQPQLRRRQRPVMGGARPPFHGAIIARSGVNSRRLSCQENSAQDRSMAPAAEAGALESLAVSMMRRRWLGSAESAFAGGLPSLSILFFWTA